eukprot:TRINITY_DN18497_c0_g1_i1.p1 TRINITY_DN18497_c0_g1~~TRINITY_DN18497_c0_g1_i1.p1  ORF type:complete len:134 (+),score=2.04 TRINITY_DN18497_c0_g1_i1:75-476(+)
MPLGGREDSERPMPGGNDNRMGRMGSGQRDLQVAHGVAARCGEQPCFIGRITRQNWGGWLIHNGVETDVARHRGPSSGLCTLSVCQPQWKTIEEKIDGLPNFSGGENLELGRELVSGGMLKNSKIVYINNDDV